MYKQAIIIFGIVIPGGVLLAVLVGMWVMLGKFEVQYDSKVKAFEASKVDLVKEKGMQAKLSSRRGQMEYWNEHFSKDIIQNFNENLEAVLARFDPNQLRMAAVNRPSGVGELSRGVEANAALFKLTFEGGYGPMQETLAELELRMPQLVLQDLAISAGRGAGQGRRGLVFEVTYMVWVK